MNDMKYLRHLLLVATIVSLIHSGLSVRLSVGREIPRPRANADAFEPLGRDRHRGDDAATDGGHSEHFRELNAAQAADTRPAKPATEQRYPLGQETDDDVSSTRGWRRVHGVPTGGGGNGGGGNGGARGRRPGGRRLRQWDTATFFNSLDENSDGVLAEDEIREFVEDVGGATLDDHSEILGGVSRVMDRLDTDSEEGIGLKELSSWINRLDSILTVEEAADWVTHAVQLPAEVSDAFRSNSVSGYDFPELVEDNGAGLYYDLGIRRTFRKRIVKAIEIRLLGLGDEPPPPILHPPSYLGGGKARIEWFHGDTVYGSTARNTPYGDRNNYGTEAEVGGVASLGDDEVALDDDRGTVGRPQVDGSSAVGSGRNTGLLGRSYEEVASKVASDPSPPAPAPSGASRVDDAPRGRGQRPPPTATFPVHKYVLQRACLHSLVAASISVGDGTLGGLAMGGGGTAAGTWSGGSGSGKEALGESAVGGGGWVTVHEADVDFASSVVFVDSGMAAGKTYVYRLRAWNLIGHSEASIAHVITPVGPSLWSKPWRVISPWWRSDNNSAASKVKEGPSITAGTAPQASSIGPAAENSADGLGVVEDSKASQWQGKVWWTLGWVWWGTIQLLKLLQTVLVLAGVCANLMRLRAAFGDEGTGAELRRNLPAKLLWKLNHFVTRNRLISWTVDAVHDRLENALGSPPPVERRLYRQASRRNLMIPATSSRSSGSGRRSHYPGRHEERTGLSRIEEEHAGEGIDAALRAERLAERRRFEDSGRARPQNSRMYQRQSHPPRRRREQRQPSARESPLQGNNEVESSEGLPFRGAYRPADAPSPRGHQTGDGVKTSPREFASPPRDESRSEGSMSSGSSPSRCRPVTDASEDSRREERGADRRRGWFEWWKAADVSTEGAGAIESSGEDRSLYRSSTGGIRRDEDSFDWGFPESDQGVVDSVPGNFYGGAWGERDDDVGGGVAMRARPKLHRHGSMDFRRGLHGRVVSVSRLALGLRKGQASGRDGWRQELVEAEACFSCRKLFRAVTKPRHHCSRCHRVFCSKHGFTSHPPVTVCSVPGDCICDACLGSMSGSTRSFASDGTLSAVSAASSVSSMNSMHSDGSARSSNSRKLFSSGMSTRFRPFRRRKKGRTRSSEGILEEEQQSTNARSPERAVPSEASTTASASDLNSFADIADVSVHSVGDRYAVSERLSEEGGALRGAGIFGMRRRITQ